MTPQGSYESWLSYNYTRTTQETQVLTSAPGKILSGGGMQVNANTVNNSDSQIIAGGALSATIGTLNNNETAGERTLTDSGSVTSYWRNHQKGRDSTGSSSSSYVPAPTIQAISLGAARYEGNASHTGSGTTVGMLSVDRMSQVASAVGGSGSVVRTAAPNPNVPNNSLFSTNPNPGSHYLIETDPRFANYRQWLSSDYMLTALAADPAMAQKRLGDGYYEQRLIREQVAQLTGRRFLDGYANDEAEYRALMDAGVTFAKAWNLVPGIALTNAQMAALTSDIVWLVEREVAGQKVLVPQVYVRVQSNDLTPSGSLIAGNSINLNLSGDLNNQGTLAGRQVVSLTAGNINNLGGLIAGQNVLASARNNINILGGTMQAENQLLLAAGNDINVQSTTRTQQGAQGSRTNIDRVAGLYVTGDNGTLVASAGNNVNLIAAAVSNTPTSGSSATSTGTTVFVAGKDINLGTVTESSSNKVAWDGNNWRKDASRTDVGTTIQTQGNVQLQAGNDINAKAAGVASNQGAVIAQAGRDINLTAGEANVSLDEAHQHKGTSSAFSSTTTTTRDAVSETTAIGTTFSGNTTVIAADRDINLKGSNAVSTQGTQLAAQNNINIEAALNTTTESHFKQEKKSGIFSSGGIGFTIGTQQLSVDNQSSATTPTASTVGSTEGNVAIQAGKNYKQVGSNVIAPQGNINITAQKVDIVEAREASQSQTETKFKQSGLTIAVTSPVLSAIQTAQQMSKAAGDTSDTRMKALAAANTAMAASTAYDAINKGQGSTINGKEGQIATGKDADGKVTSRDANAADKVGGINLSVSIGSSQSSSKTTQTSDTAAGSTVAAGKDLTITATGAGKDSNLIVQGSNLSAGNNLSLKADNEVQLLAAQNTAEQHSTNKNSSASLGFSIGTNGLVVNAGVSGGRGKADGSDVTWTNTQVNAGNNLNIESGGDTTLKGAVVSAKQVLANVGGNLNMESLQDTSKYDSKQQSLGVSVSVGAGMVSGSISASQSKVNSDYASVTEQTGIQAGDGGFQVKVQGNTDLKGAVIASTDKAVQDGKNSLTTASLTTSDIQNKASYSANSTSVNFGSGVSFDGKLTPGGTGAGLGKDSGNAESVTQAGISGIAGNQATRTGDAQTSIAKIFDADKVQKEINAQTQITQMFGQQASALVDTYTTNQMKKLRDGYASASSPEEKQALQERVDQLRLESHVLNVLIGAVTGMGGSAVTRESLAAGAEEMRQITLENSKLFKGITDGTTVLSNLTGVSEGGKWDLDPFKGGGTRVDLDNICGTANERCKTQIDSVTGKPILDEKGIPKLALKDGMVQWDTEKTEGQTLAKYLDSAKGQEVAGATGGIQGWKGTFFGRPYAAGSWQDKLIIAFEGTHDLIGGQITGLYDAQGNTKRGMSGTEQFLRDRVSEAALIPSTPFAMSVYLPPEVWNAISIYLKAMK